MVPSLCRVVEHAAFPKTFQVVGTAVAVVDVIGVFPHVAGQQRRVFSGQRRSGVGSRNQIQSAGRGFYQPRPTGAESTGRAGIERFLEFLEAAPFRVDGGGQFAGRFALTFGRETQPVEGVVPSLCRVVEHAA